MRFYVTKNPVPDQPGFGAGSIIKGPVNALVIFSAGSPGSLRFWLSLTLPEQFLKRIPRDGEGDSRPWMFLEGYSHLERFQYHRS
jgi:hypothetical protein